MCVCALWNSTITPPTYVQLCPLVIIIISRFIIVIREARRLLLSPDILPARTDAVAAPPRPSHCPHCYRTRSPLCVLGIQIVLAGLFGSGEPFYQVRSPCKISLCGRKQWSDFCLTVHTIVNMSNERGADPSVM
jgi:hypothetical protein